MHTNRLDNLMGEGGHRTHPLCPLHFCPVQLCSHLFSLYLHIKSNSLRRYWGSEQPWKQLWSTGAPGRTWSVSPASSSRLPLLLNVAFGQEELPAPCAHIHSPIPQALAPQQGKASN